MTEINDDTKITFFNYAEYDEKTLRRYTSSIFPGIRKTSRWPGFYCVFDKKLETALIYYIGFLQFKSGPQIVFYYNTIIDKTQNFIYAINNIQLKDLYNIWNERKDCEPIIKKFLSININIYKNDKNKNHKAWAAGIILGNDD